MTNSAPTFSCGVLIVIQPTSESTQEFHSQGWLPETISAANDLQLGSCVARIVVTFLISDRQSTPRIRGVQAQWDSSRKLRPESDNLLKWYLPGAAPQSNPTLRPRGRTFRPLSLLPLVQICPGQ